MLPGKERVSMVNDLEGFKAALIAIDDGSPADLKRVLDGGLDPNFQPPNNDHRLLGRLLWRAPKEVALEMAQLLLAAGADVNHGYSEGEPHFRHAQSIELLELLLASGACVDVESLTYLAHRWHGRKPIFEFLARHGFRHDWSDSLRQVFHRMQHCQEDGIPMVDVLDDATPFIQSRIGVARECLAEIVEIEYFRPMQELYALGRVNDLLVNGLLPRGKSKDWPFERVTQTDYVGLLTGFGFEVVEARSEFVPFYHEIVSVEQDPDDDLQPVIEEEIWPTTVLDVSGYASNPGPAKMVFSRAGVRVRAGKNHIEKQAAETSRLYWAFRRANRDCNDLSHGWGSNSQWRTNLRLDIATDTHYRFNVNGRNDDEAIDLAVDNQWSRSMLVKDQIDRDRAEELLVNRCFLKSHPTIDPWLYAYFLDKPIDSPRTPL